MKIPIENPPEIKVIELHLKNNGINSISIPSFAYMDYYIISISKSDIDVFTDGTVLKVCRESRRDFPEQLHDDIKLCDPGSLDYLVRVLKEILNECS